MTLNKYDLIDIQYEYSLTSLFYIRVIFGLIHVCFSENLAKFTEDFVCSVIVGQDLVPRLSLSSMEELKCNLLRVTRDSKQPKVTLLLFTKNLYNIGISIVFPGPGYFVKLCQIWLCRKTAP